MFRPGSFNPSTEGSSGLAPPSASTILLFSSCFPHLLRRLYPHLDREDPDPNLNVDGLENLKVTMTLINAGGESSNCSTMRRSLRIPSPLLVPWLSPVVRRCKGRSSIHLHCKHTCSSFRFAFRLKVTYATGFASRSRRFHRRHSLL